VLRRDGGFLLAVLPASRRIHLQDLRTQVGDSVQFATEEEIAEYEKSEKEENEGKKNKKPLANRY